MKYLLRQTHNLFSYKNSKKFHAYCSKKRIY